MPGFLEAISSSTNFIIFFIARDLGPKLCRVHKFTTKNSRAIRLVQQQLRINPQDVSIKDLVFFLGSGGGVRLSSLGTSAAFGLLYQPRMIYNDECGAVYRIIIGREAKYSEKTCPSTCLSIINPT
jgi:hypothetical protein